jgi:hypothetical protein
LINLSPAWLAFEELDEQDQQLMAEASELRGSIDAQC